MRLKHLLFLFLFAMLIVSCEENPFKNIDVSGSEVKVRSKHLENDVFAVDFSQPATARQTLYQNYGEFICRYVRDLLKVGPCGDDTTFYYMQGFAMDQSILRIKDAIAGKFTSSDFEKWDNEFSDALTRWHYFFPDSVVPSIVYMNSGLNYQAFATDSSIGIGVDCYLGKDHPLIKEVPSDAMPQYVKDDFESKFLVSNGIRDWIYMRTVFYDDGNDLLSKIIFEGKRMFLLDVLLPEVADSIKMNWSSEQMLWAESNEGQVWEELARQEVLFETKPLDINKWTDPAPFTNFGKIPTESPGQLGIWMGWNVVRDYMMQNKELTLQQLLNEKNYQKMLKAYHP
jgi:hypothetical protein